MKKTCRILLLASIAFILFNCDNGGIFDIAQGLESVSGVVCNENGDPLENIQIEIYYDQELTKQYADKEPVAYTNSLGQYSFSQVARGGVDSLDLYVFAIDTAGKYQPARQKVQLIYQSCSITDKGTTMTSYTGHAVADFRLQRNWCRTK